MTMTKVVAYIALLYGRDYLRWAIRSVIDYVDELYVFYSTTGGSHGFITDLPCPETREELYAEALIGAGAKLRWFDGNWAAENQQRAEIYKRCPDADIILVLDSDEIWHEKLVRMCIAEAKRFDRRFLRVPMVHFWRSFSRAVLHDPAYPERLIMPKVEGGEGTVDVGGLRISHMGYAQNSAIVGFKQHVHGHRPEWRKDCDWYTHKFMRNAQHDCHPVGSMYWEPEFLDPLQYMPDFMRNHPYWGLELIP